MNTIRQFLLICVMLCGASWLQAATNYMPLSSQEEQRYYNALEDQVDKAQQRLTDLVQQGVKLKPQGQEDDASQAVAHAAEMVDTKETLVKEFEGKQSLRSPLVRAKLLEVVSKDNITDQDLQNLQRVVNSEKANIKAYDSQKAPK